MFHYGATFFTIALQEIIVLLHGIPFIPGDLT
jgi:hypothetical protein